MKDQKVTLMKGGFRPLLGIVWVIIAGVLNVRAELNVVSLEPHTPARMGNAVGVPVTLVKVVFDKPIELSADSNYALVEVSIKNKNGVVRMAIDSEDESHSTIKGFYMTDYEQGLFKFSLAAGSVHEKGKPDNANGVVEWKARFTNAIIPPVSSLDNAERSYIIPEDLEFVWTGEHLETHSYIDPESGDTLAPFARLTEVVPCEVFNMETYYSSPEVYRSYPLKEYYNAETHTCTYRVDPTRLAECPDTIWLQKDHLYGFKLSNVLDVEQPGYSYKGSDGKDYIDYVTDTEFCLPIKGSTPYNDSLFITIEPLRGRLYHYTDTTDGNEYIGDVLFETNVKASIVSRIFPTEEIREICLHAVRSDKKYRLYNYSSDMLIALGFTCLSAEELGSLHENFTYNYVLHDWYDGRNMVEFDSGEEYELICQPNEFCTSTGNFSFSDGFSFPLEVCQAASVNRIFNDGESRLPMYDLYGRRINKVVRGQIYIQGGKKYIDR